MVINKIKITALSLLILPLAITLFTSVFYTIPTYAASVTATQQLTINVAPDAPDTGSLVPPFIPNLSTVSPYLIATVLALLVGIVFLVYKFKSSKNVKHMAFLSVITIIGVCSVITFATFAVSGVLDIHAAVEPTVTFSHDSLEYSIQPGGSSHFMFDATVITDLDSPGYKMSAISNNTHSGINLSISGEDLENKVTIPSIESEPIVVRESDENAAIGHTASHAIHVTLDDSVAYGSYIINVIYTIESAAPLALPELPVGSNPSNVTETNPLVLDVYPTTGWEGDTVAITSDALFTNVESVTIGGMACISYNVVSSSLIACVLPSQTAGTSNNIVVMNNGMNVTNASIYTHMKIVYFDPSKSTVDIAGTTYAFYPDGFTSSDCSSLVLSNDPIGSTQPASMVYVRDTRNKQTYKIKKMADNKCWMVDNLKYIDTEIANSADGTTGMVFNNGDPLNDGFGPSNNNSNNTVAGNITRSGANYDKAFYNNPMRVSYCYGNTDMPAKTLTHCGYLYNWYAATNGAGTYDESTQGTNVTGSICPANFRLPSVSSDGSTTTGDGTSYSAADFAVLNASMAYMSPMAGETGSSYFYYRNWLPSGAWGGVYSGNWGFRGGSQGTIGAFHSSTVISDYSQQYANFQKEVVYPFMPSVKPTGLAVRCVME